MKCERPRITSSANLPHFFFRKKEKLPTKRRSEAVSLLEWDAVPVPEASSFVFSVCAGEIFTTAGAFDNDGHLLFKWLLNLTVDQIIQRVGLLNDGESAIVDIGI